MTKKSTTNTKKATTGTQTRHTTRKTGAKTNLSATRRGASGSRGAELKPVSLNIRSYQVGFGDCFLLSFHYPDAEKPQDRQRHVLIDFGSTGLPSGTPRDQMMRVAEDIRNQCGGKLHVVVATHRHKDHISGFTTQPDGKGTGDVIAALKPDMVIQPWTEDPNLHDEDLSAFDQKEADKPFAPTALQLRALQISALDSMQEVSEAMLSEVRHLSDRDRFRQPLSDNVAGQIAFLADDNGLPNKSAVENLRNMGKNYYVHHGYKLDLSKLLPGVDIKVLGPPTLEQHAGIQKQRSADKTEFWMLHAAAQNFWQQQALTGQKLRRAVAEEEHLFPDADITTQFVPSHSRWFVRQVRAMRGQQMLGLVRILDKAMNNTSVILLMEIAGKKLLFPGDAQIENWQYALSLEEDVELLKDVFVYKVGHHGSRNATPKSLWEHFDRKGDKALETGRLKTVISTMEGKHGSRASHSEVPRDTLVEALSSLSDYHTTQKAAADGQLFEDIMIEFS
jgi:beta-lactamase superfamily II metal-dependent hydrolase